MKRAVVLQHVEFEGPERVAQALANAGFVCEPRRLDQGDAVPTELLRGDVLVVMGGPMGVGDLEDPAYPFLAREVALLERCLRTEVPVLGICLGSQLLAHAAGARVYPATRAPAHLGAQPERVYEVGWAPLDFHVKGKDPVLAGLAAREMMLHWHGDTFDLPKGAELLASTDACPNQAFRVAGRCFGLQFHCEVEPETIERWLEEGGDFVTRANGPDGMARIRAETERYMPELRKIGDRLLENVVRAMVA